MRPLEGLSDEALIEEARRAEGAAREELIGELFQRHYQRVAGWCLNMSRDPTDALDLAQEVFIKAHQALGQFRGDSTVATWLYVIARRTHLDGIRAAKRRPAGSWDESQIDSLIGHDGDEIEANAITNQDIRELRMAMGSLLNSHERQALHLRYVEGLSVAEVTQRMKLVNRSGAKALIVSSFRKLRRHFNS